MGLASLRRRLDRLRSSPAGPDYSLYRTDPAGYARDVLGVRWWAKQIEIAEALLSPPYRVLVKASHSVGKSHVSAGLVNWWYDTRIPSIAVTTAPKFDQVKDVLWKEIRLQRGRRGGFPGPKMPRMESASDHYAVGVTADRAEGIQGQHGPAVLFVFDEAVGVDRHIWEAADSMMMGVEYAHLCICNPTDLTSEFYRREQQTEVPYTVISISCLEHPNIAAELAGLPPPYPSAVRLAWVDERVKEWCERTSEPEPTDIEWPPGSGEWWRPGPDAEARLLGRWPSQACGVWSDALFGRCESLVAALPPADVLPVIGCDVAREGDDDTVAHVRCGPVSLHHDSANGRTIDGTIGHLRQVAADWARWLTGRRDPQADPVDPKSIPINVDDGGVGGGVVDVLRSQGYRVAGIAAGSRPRRPDRYPNVRSELWFATAEKARLGLVSFARLDSKSRHRIRVQAMAPVWRLDAASRRVVEPKDKTKEKAGRSPDDMDAVNLAYYEVSASEYAQGVAAERTPIREAESQAEKRGLWGRT